MVDYAFFVPVLTDEQWLCILADVDVGVHDHDRDRDHDGDDIDDYYCGHVGLATV